MQEVWRDTFVTDDVLIRCVSELRKVFGDSAANPAFIETIPKKGYKALEIDDCVADAHAALAFVRLVSDWDWQGSQAELRRAIKLGPNLESGHYVYSHWCVAKQLYQAATTEANVALSIDPLSAKLSFHLGAVHYYARQYDEAIEEFRKTMELDPLFAATHQMLACAYARKGMWHDAIAESERGLALSGGSLQGRRPWAAAGALMGRQLEAREVLDELKQESGPPHCVWMCRTSCAVGGARRGFRVARQGLAGARRQSRLPRIRSTF